jgi:large subunit ribosomal protein L10
LSLSLEQKQAMVSEVSAQLKGAQTVIVAEYRGLDVGRFDLAVIGSNSKK